MYSYEYLLAYREILYRQFLGVKNELEKRTVYCRYSRLSFTLGTHFRVSGSERIGLPSAGIELEY